MFIRLAEATDLSAYFNHCIRLESESGKSLETIFSPFENITELKFSEKEDQIKTQIGKIPSEIGWGKLWVLKEGKDIYGHIWLCHQLGVKSSLHRATLMMGIERQYRSQGYGMKLIGTAIEWAKNQPSLEWIDLFVFSNNQPAARLYKKFGFSEIGTTEDMFRVHGQKISDTKMVLKIR